MVGKSQILLFKTKNNELNILNTTNNKIKTESEILGIKFSNITIPDLTDINDEVIGYYIVRNKREESDKTILDTGILFPLLNKHNKFIASGMMFPRCTNTDQIDKRTFGIIHPEYKFHDKEYSDYNIIQEGIFKRTDFRLTSNLIQDVQAGTSFITYLESKQLAEPPLPPVRQFFLTTASLIANFLPPTSLMLYSQLPGILVLYSLYSLGISL